MIVGDDERLPGILLDFANARGPRIEFLRRIKVVIVFVDRGGGIITEPGVVAAAVETNVADRRSGLGRRLERTADDGLIDVAKPDLVAMQKFECFLGLPRGVAKFNNERIVGESFEDPDKMSDSFAVAMKREGKLDKNGAEFARIAKHVEASPNRTFIFGGSARFVGESLPKFCGEQESGIRGDAIDPHGSVVGPQRLVERRVDFDGVEETGEISSFVELFSTRTGIYVTGPIWIRPSSGANEKLVGGIW